MNDIGYIFTGGFAKGYRTYILSGLGVVTAVVLYAVGDADLVHTINSVAIALGLGTLRAAV